MQTTATVTGKLEQADLDAITAAVVTKLTPLIPTVDKVAEAVWKRALSPVTSPTDNAASWVRRAAIGAEGLQSGGLESSKLTSIIADAIVTALTKAGLAKP